MNEINERFEFLRSKIKILTAEIKIKNGISLDGPQ